MEDLPLNKAHQFVRRAEVLLRQKKFDECMDCHRSAVKYLNDSLALTDNSYSKESIQLQIEYSQKRLETLKIRKMQYEDLKQYQENLKNREIQLEQSYESVNLQTHIFRTLNTHDSLVELMDKRHVEEMDKRNVEKTDVNQGVSARKPRQKVDDNVLLEEFRGLSDTLREVVEILSTQVEEDKREIDRLKSHIDKLVADKSKDDVKSGNSLKVVTDSSGFTSPYVFSPCSELSPEISDLRSLPTVPPHTLPKFDYSSLIQNVNDLNLNGST